MATRTTSPHKPKSLDDVLSMVEVEINRIVAAMLKDRSTGTVRRARRRTKIHADAA